MKVLIVDRNTELAKENARGFNSINAAVYLYNGNEYIRHPALGSDATSEVPESIDLVLVNQDDAGLLPRSLGDATIVRYRSERPARELWIRSRALSSHSPLSKDEALSLVEWSSKGASVDNKPVVMLSPGKELDFISAMAIMCQGYLASHFPNPENADGTTKEALDKIGWTSKYTSTQCGVQVADISHAKKEETEQPFWWVELFDSTRFSNFVNEDTYDVSEFKREAKYHQLGKATQEIVDKLSLRECISDSDLVARAYLEMQSQICGLETEVSQSTK